MIIGLEKSVNWAYKLELLIVISLSIWWKSKHITKKKSSYFSFKIIEFLC